MLRTRASACKYLARWQFERAFLFFVCAVLFCSPAQADFGPEVEFAIWHLLAFAAAIVSLPLLASTGRRLLWFFSVLIGYPLSIVLIGKFALWVDTAHYASDSTATLLTLITWAWIVCVRVWLRLTRSQREATLSFAVSAPVPISRSSDLFALLTVTALLFDSQALVVQLTRFDPPAVIGAAIAYCALPLIAVMGIWRRQRWAWWLAIASTILAICLSIRLLPPLTQFSDPAIGLMSLVVLAINNSILVSLALRIAAMCLLLLPLRKQQSELCASATQ